MANRAAKLVSAVIVSAVVGMPVSTFAKDPSTGLDASTPDSNASAANSSNECLTTPNRMSPQGQRWTYRIEPGTNRRCWLLRDRVAQAASPRSNPSQLPFADAQSPPPAPSPAPKAFSKNAKALRALANARGEVEAGAAAVETAGVTVPKTPVFITTGSAGSNRGGSAGTDSAQGTSATLSSSMDASTTGSVPDARAGDGPFTSSLNTGLAPSSASEMPAMANMPQDKPSASLQVLFLVILGALALAGIIASLTHRMPRMWRHRHARLRRDSIWFGSDGGRQGSWDRRSAGAQPDDQSGQIKRLLTQIAKQAGGKGKKRVPARPRAASAARVRTPSGRRGVRA